MWMDVSSTSNTASIREPSASSTKPSPNGWKPPGGGTNGGDFGGNRCTVQVHSVPTAGSSAGTGSAALPLGFALLQERRDSLGRVLRVERHPDREVLHHHQRVHVGVQAAVDGHLGDPHL